LSGFSASRKEQLRHHQIGGHVIDRADQENHALLEQARVDVVGALATTALLDHHRDQAQRLRIPVAAVVYVHFASFAARVLRVQDCCPINSAKATGLSTTFTRPAPSPPRWPRSPRLEIAQALAAAHSTSGRPPPDGRSSARLLDQRPHLLRLRLQFVAA
jgi:hypothetical protein